MKKSITLTGKQVEVLRDLLQDHKIDMEDQCCEGTQRYANLLALNAHIERSIN
jgi:hypothetical protein